MAKKPGSKKTLKSLFSKSEVNLTEAAAAESGVSGVSVDRKPDKKKFKFPSLKIKSKSSGASEKAAPESQQVLSVERPDLNDASSADNVSTDTDRSSLYATAPRSKGKERSVSELDLTSKSKRFATIHLGLRKKKKKEESVLSKSTFGIDGSGIEGQLETPSDLSQMPLAPDVKTMSRSQPELDTSERFDIPSPPPVSVNKPEFTLPSQSQTSVTVHSQPTDPQLVINAPSETPKAPIATIPELKLDDDLTADAKYTTQNGSTYKEAAAGSSTVKKELLPFTMPKFDVENDASVVDGNVQASNTKLDIPISQVKASTSDLKTSTTLGDEPKIDPGINLINSNSVLDSKMAATNLDKQVETSIPSKMELDTTVTKSSTVDPIVSQNTNIPTKTTTFLSQSKIGDYDEGKINVTIEEKQPTITNVFPLDPKITSVNLDKKVESSSVSKPVKLDTTVTDKSTLGPIVSQNTNTSTRTTTFMSQSKIPDYNEAKMGITVEEKQPTITSVFAVDPKMKVESSSSTIDISSVSKPAKLNTRITETPMIYGDAMSDVAQSRPKMSDRDQDNVYGTLYDSLFPQKFTQEVISSLLNSPTKLASQHKSLETMTERVLVTRFESERMSTPLSTSSPEKIGNDLSELGSASANIDSFVEETLTKDAPKTVYIRKITTYDVTSSTDAKPTEEVGRFSYSEFNTEAKYDTGNPLDTMKPSTYAEKSPPLFNYAPSQETNAQVSADSKRKVVLVKELVSDEVASASSSKDSGRLSPVLEKTLSSTEPKMEEFEISSVTSGPMELLDGICSPAYLSVGSDDGSTIEAFFSAEEDNSDDLCTADDRDKTVINTTSVLEDPLSNSTIVLREDANASVNSGEKTLEMDLQRPSRVVEMQVENDGSGVFWERVMKAENESELELPAAPVERVKEFEVVPPFTEDIGRKEGQGVSQIEPQDTPVVQLDSNAESELSGGANVSKSVLGGSSASSSKWQSTPRFAEGAERVLSSENAKESMLGDGAEEISGASGNNRAAVSVREAGTVTASAGRSRAEQVAIAAAPGQTSSTTLLLITEEKTQEQEPGPDQETGPDRDQQDLSQGSVPSSQTPGIEQRFSDAAALDPEAERMSSGYSSLSTTLSLKTSGLSQSEDATYRVKKVSLVSESEDAVDSSAVTPGNGTDTGHRWRNRFEGVYQFKTLSDTYKPSDYSLRSTITTTSTSTSSTSSTATALPEATDYNSVSTGAEKPGSLSPVLSDRLDDTAGAGGRGLAERGAGLSAAPAADRSEGESDGVGSQQDAPPPQQQQQTEEDVYSGVFKATLVDLVPEPPLSPPAGAPLPPPVSPDEADSPSQFDMDSLVDTLKNMGPSMRMRSLSARGAPSGLLTSLSLPPIVEDAPGAAPLRRPALDGLNGNIYSLPPDIGLKKSSLRDMRSPLELMKQDQGSRTLPTPLRASATNSIVMRTSADSSPEDLPSPVHLNGSTGSRLDNSLIFSSLRSSSIDQTSENGAKTHRSLFRASSLPDIGLSNERVSLPPKENGDVDNGASRFERISFLLNATSSSSGGSLTGAEDYGSRISRAPPLSIGSPPSSNSPTALLSPTGSLELNRTFTPTMADSSPIRTAPPPLLQRSFSGDSGVSLHQGAPVFNTVQNFQNHFQPQEPEPERNLLSKYRAFPDAYLTKEKEHGRLNPRPGKMYVFDRPGMCGERTEIRSDVVDATSWELQETISIRVVRGGWVLYEKPNFKGEKIALDEGELELTYPFGPMEEETPNGQMNGQMNGGQTNGGQTNGGQTNGEQTSEAQTNGEQNGEASETSTEEAPVRRFIIGSIRRAVRDYSVPEISLFPEQNAEGKKVVFRDTSEDARIFGFPIKANSIIINAGLWLVYGQPFFQGVPRVLEVGGYPNPEAWGVEQPYVASLHPLKIGEPRVENMAEPKMVVFEKPYFCGKSRTITTNSRDFITRTDRQQQAFMHNVGSLKVMGGIWVGYEKEGFRGHQYLLEEGDYQDWRVWGGADSELRSVRVIRADLTDPLMVMFEQPEEEQEEQEENTFEVSEAIPDVELFGFKTSTRSIQVVSGAWVAYSHVDFSGNQYILEKGFYNNYADWGSLDSRVCSVQPILTVPRDDTKNRSQMLLYTEPDFQGQCFAVDRNMEALSDKLLPKSCKVVDGSWVLYENKQFQGNQYVLSDGDYPNLGSMGCPASCFLRSVKAVPMTLSVPSISLFGLECLEGREITTETKIFSLVEEGYNPHILSVRINSGCWVLCEHSNYRGRQFLLEPIEITNWPKFSSLQTIGSMYPVRQRHSLFRVKNKELGHYLSVQGGVEEMKSGRVVVSPEAEPMSDVWYYQDGLVKSKLSPSMCLQVMGNIEPAAKVVLWTETRQPVQSWTAQMKGLISSFTFPGMVLDVKGGKAYDKNHVVILPEDEERPSQQWEIEML